MCESRTHAKATSRVNGHRLLFIGQILAIAFICAADAEFPVAGENLRQGLLVITPQNLDEVSQIALLPGNGNSIQAMGFSGEHTVITVNSVGEMLAWETINYTVEQLCHIDGVVGRIVSLSANGQRFSYLDNVEDRDRAEIHVIDTNSCAELLSQSLSAYVNFLELNPTGELLGISIGSARWNQRVEVWNVSTETLIAVHEGYDWVQTIDFGNPSSLAVNYGQTARIWQGIEDFEPTTVEQYIELGLGSLSQHITEMAFNREATLLATQDGSGNLWIWATANGELVRQLFAGTTEDSYHHDTEEEIRSLSRIAFGLDSDVLVSTDGKTLSLFDLSNGTLTVSYSLEVEGVSLSPNGRLLAVILENGDIALWGVRSVSE